jgi:predicted HicB family RNase H-like nuclease
MGRTKTLYVDEELHRRLKQVAGWKGESLRAFVHRALSRELLIQLQVMEITGHSEED